MRLVLFRFASTFFVEKRSAIVSISRSLIRIDLHIVFGAFYGKGFYGFGSFEYCDSQHISEILIFLIVLPFYNHICTFWVRLIKENFLNYLHFGDFISRSRILQLFSSLDFVFAFSNVFLLRLLVQFRRKGSAMANPAAVAAAIVLSFAVLVNFALHKIEEGHVGVYYRVSCIWKMFFGPRTTLLIGVL